MVKHMPKIRITTNDDRDTPETAFYEINALLDDIYLCIDPKNDPCGNVNFAFKLDDGKIINPNSSYADGNWTETFAIDDVDEEWDCFQFSIERELDPNKLPKLRWLKKKDLEKVKQGKLKVFEGTGVGWCIINEVDTSVEIDGKPMWSYFYSEDGSDDECPLVIGQTPQDLMVHDSGPWGIFSGENIFVMNKNPNDLMKIKVSCSVSLNKEILDLEEGVDYSDIEDDDLEYQNLSKEDKSIVDKAIREYVQEFKEFMQEEGDGTFEEKIAQKELLRKLIRDHSSIEIDGKHIIITVDPLNYGHKILREEHDAEITDGWWINRKGIQLSGGHYEHYELVFN